MSDEKYNGWTNYETWNVSLWIDNDQGLQEMVSSWAQEAYEQADGDKDDAALAVGKQIQEFVEENNPLSGDASMYSDMLGAAISEVNWYEIGQGYCEEGLVEFEKSE